MKYRLMINGEEREVEVDSGTPLLWVLRDELGLTGTKYSCGVAQCGACTVHLDGKPVRSCVTPMRNLKKREVTTIEGVEGLVADAVRESWETIQVPQCGYCQSGQIMTAIALLESQSDPEDEEIDAALTGNICRCATYPRIRRAVHEAAAKVRS
ncbi:MAG: (2Fe-2S)-binding protein [bacterium]|nr:(2Fe-2S)-binding protein [bacterium]